MEFLDRFFFFSFSLIFPYHPPSGEAYWRRTPATPQLVALVALSTLEEPALRHPPLHLPLLYPRKA